MATLTAHIHSELPSLRASSAPHSTYSNLFLGVHREWGRSIIPPSCESKAPTLLLEFESRWPLFPCFLLADKLLTLDPRVRCRAHSQAASLGSLSHTPRASTRDRISCSAGWFQTHYTAKGDLELQVLLPLSPKGLKERCVSPYPAACFLQNLAKSAAYWFGSGNLPRAPRK